MIELLAIIFVGIMLAAMIYFGGILYLMTGAWIADRLSDAGVPDRVCVTSIFFAPGAIVATVYLLGDFALGFILSGGLH
jgi:hypothetical protein